MLQHQFWNPPFWVETLSIPLIRGGILAKCLTAGLSFSICIMTITLVPTS